MIFVQGEPTSVAKAKITSTFQGLLPNEEIARDYLNEVKRDLRRLSDQYWDNAFKVFGRDRSGEDIYDHESISSIRETVKNLENQLQPLEPKKTFSEEWAETPVKDKVATWVVGLIFFAGFVYFVF